MGVPQVVEGGIGDKQEAVEDESAHQEVAVEQDQFAGLVAGGEKPHDKLRAGPQQQPHHRHVGDIEHQGIGQGGAHPVVAPGAGILADDGPYRTGQGKHGGEGQRGDPPHDRRAGDRTVAKPGHGRQYKAAAQGSGDIG